MNADEGLGTVRDVAYGVNQAVWDGNMNIQASVDLLGRARVRMMRYPGGSYGDGYHWQTNTVSGGRYVAGVRYANVTKGYGVKYWEIGNEVYGDGYYGADWELDNHASKSPAAYVTNVVDYAKAIKAVDPTVKIGVVLTLPNSWPDGVVASGDSRDWNQTVLPIVGPYMDFAIIHCQLIRARRANRFRMTPSRLG